jgi:hypothetical protein
LVNLTPDAPSLLGDAERLVERRQPAPAVAALVSRPLELKLGCTSVTNAGHGLCDKKTKECSD